MTCDIYRHLDGITRNQRGEWVESDGSPVSPERRRQYHLDERQLRPMAPPVARRESRR